MSESTIPNAADTLARTIWGEARGCGAGYVDTRGNITVGIGRNLTGSCLSDSEIMLRRCASRRCNLAVGTQEM